MWQNWAYQEANYQREIACSHDLFTNIARNTNQVINTIIGVPLLPIQLITTFVFGLLAQITFGIFLWIGSAIWVIFLGILLATSWLWLKVPLLRVLLFLPGIIWAVISSIFASLMPCMGEFDARKIKLDLCNIWPLSWNLFKQYKH